MIIIGAGYYACYCILCIYYILRLLALLCVLTNHLVSIQLAPCVRLACC